MMLFRTDINNNPTAFTTDLAKEAGLVEGTDYAVGDSFKVSGHEFFTAKILGDPIAVTIKLIDKVGFYTMNGVIMRWVYIAIPFKLWMQLTVDQKKYVISYMYSREGGTALRPLFS